MELVKEIYKETLIIQGHRNMLGKVDFEQSGVLIKSIFSLIELVEQQQSKNERLQTNLDHACGLSIENIRIANELQAQISEKDTLIESLEQKYIDATSDLMDQKNEIIESQKAEIERWATRVYYAIQIWENMDMEDDPVRTIQKVISHLQEGEKP